MGRFEMLTSLFIIPLHLIMNYCETQAMDTNVALGKNVTRSSAFPLGGWGPDNAVDGVIDQINDNTCDCCSATQVMTDPWFRVDLGGMYMVSAFSVFTRQLNKETFKTTDIYFHDTESNIGIATTTIQEDVISYNHTFTSPVTARYVTVKYNGRRVFVLCEIEVYGECVDGTFGDSCGSVCHCEGPPCNKTSGVCPSGSCLPGYRGDKCDTPCEAGTYGQDCGQTCGQCRNNEICHHVDGSCTQCEDGYNGTTCKQECPAGNYGQFCGQTCGRCRHSEICNHVDGSCTECEDGYRGVICKQECLSGQYGQNCSETCGNCYNNEICGHVDGTCKQCEAGYTGSTCKENCTPGRYGLDCANTCGACAESPCHHVTGVCSNCSAGYLTQYCNKTCPMGTYGYNCSSTCGNCLVNTTCHHENGHCVSGCEDGYIGSTCDTEGSDTEKQIGGDGSQTAVIAGVAGSLIFVLLAAGIVGFVLLRRRRKTPTKRDMVNGNGRGSAYMSNVQETGHVNNVYDYDSISAEQIVEKENLPDDNIYSESKKKKTKPIEKKDQPSHEYYSFLPKNIKISDLVDYIYSRNSEQCEEFYKEYSMLKDGLTASYKVAESSENKGKNRYRGLYAYDHSRVKLDVEEAGETDYINANYIHGYDRQEKFIASQGPTKAMINDFWRMLWQKKTEIIVMLTNLVEMGTNKCEQYWPEGEDGAVTSFGSIEVKLLKTEDCADYDIRRLEVKKSTVYTNDESPAICITQYHFKAWPDKDVPDTTWCLVNFWRVVDRAIVQTETKVPIVVHCSAGIGRTGTFIALDNLHYQAINEGYVNPFNIVSKLRDQRVKMVQTPVQYIYLHEAVADSLLQGTHFVSTSQMEEICIFMSQPYSNSKVTNYDQQFKRIQESIKDEKPDDNEYSNMDEEIVQGTVKAEHQLAQYFQSLGAYYLPVWTKGNGIIVTRTPSRENVKQFWTMVVNKNVKTIIMTESGPEKICPKRDSAGFDLDNCAIKFTSDKTFDSFTIDTISTENSKQTRVIRCYTFMAWEDGRAVPPDTQSVIDLLNHLTNWQTQLSLKEPVVVCCSDGGTRSGLVSVLMNEVSRIRSIGDGVNIVESVKTMKDVNKNIITSSEQLKFIYESILCSLQQIYQNDDVYQNV